MPIFISKPPDEDNRRSRPLYPAPLSAPGTSALVASRPRCHLEPEGEAVAVHLALLAVGAGRRRLVQQLDRQHLARQRLAVLRQGLGERAVGLHVEADAVADLEAGV